MSCTRFGLPGVVRPPCHPTTVASMSRSIPLQHWGATKEEIASTMPGDELIAGPAAEGTRSITIDAEAAVVFDFVAQMGFGRAGWYSYDLLDNLGRRSADEVNPEWVVAVAGEPVPGGPIKFVAALVERPTAYVLQVPTRNVLGHKLDFTLAYALTTDGATGGTRLVTRVRIAVDGPSGTVLEQALLLGDGAMVRKQLLGLKSRTEAAPIGHG